MKFINNIYSHYRKLSWVSIRILQASLCIFCLTLTGAIILILFPDITGNHVQSGFMVRELMDCAPRLLTLGVVTAFSSDIIIHM